MDVIEKLKYITLLWIRWEDRKSVTSWDVYKNLFLDVIRYIQLIIFVILCVRARARKYMCVSLCVLYITWPGNSQTMGMAVMLDEIINYVHSLKNQVEVIKLKIKRRCNHDDAVVLMFKSLAIIFFFSFLPEIQFLSMELATACSSYNLILETGATEKAQVLYQQNDIFVTTFYLTSLCGTNS